MLDLLKKRRSIRRFKEEPLQPEEIERLVTAALLSPSSRGRQPWEFIMVTEPALLEKLSVSKPSSASFLKGAALGVVILADPGISDVWVEDTSIAALLVHLTAASMELGSCWIQIRGREHSPAEMAGDYIKRWLDIPGKYEVEAIIAVGYPDENKVPRNEKDLPYEKVHREKFGTPWPK
ncbi:MAG: nitroreductase family protein [Syntrophomonadaceae bacterium]